MVHAFILFIQIEPQLGLEIFLVRLFVAYLTICAESATAESTWAQQALESTAEESEAGTVTSVELVPHAARTRAAKAKSTIAFFIAL
jgi:hypothetical protein